MARIDAIYLEDPSSASRRIVHYLAREGIPISRGRVRNLMRRMGLRAIYQKPRTTIPGSPSERIPSLVELDNITSIDHVWATDITYIPMRKGFLYLVAIMDLFSRNVLSWKLSNSLDTQFCMDALEMALESGRRPEIFHSDQGCQFTSVDFVAKLQAEEIKISCLVEGAATTTSWLKDSGVRSSMRRFISVPTVMVGRQKSAWLDSYGGTAM